MWQTIPLWPTEASTISRQVDGLYALLILITGGVTLLVFAVITFFILKYRHQRHPVAEQIEGSTVLEITWSVVPLGLFLIFFAWGASIYIAEAKPPKDAMEVYVVAKQWMWKFQYQTGQSEINTLHLPLNRPVRLTMISQDVIHSFYAPEMRVKADVLPGRYTTTWFQPIKAGRYHLFCAEYCGTQHSGMIGEIDVLEPAAYEAWLQGGGGEGSLAATGQRLFQELGCANCHRFDAQGRGPNLQGVYGRPVLLDDGRTVLANDDYVRESILVPGAKIVAGYKNLMPSFQGMVSEEQLLALIAYVKSLATPAPPGAAAGKRPPPAKTTAAAAAP
jgi:cytochrome c oxidase subunit 2